MAIGQQRSLCRRFANGRPGDPIRRADQRSGIPTALAVFRPGPGLVGQHRPVSQGLLGHGRPLLLGGAKSRRRRQSVEAGNGANTGRENKNYRQPGPYWGRVFLLDRDRIGGSRVWARSSVYQSATPVPKNDGGRTRTPFSFSG